MLTAIAIISPAWLLTVEQERRLTVLGVAHELTVRAVLLLKVARLAPLLVRIALAVVHARVRLQVTLY